MNTTARVLVVEDNALLLLDLIDALGEHGIEAVAATSADAALPILLAGSFDAVITDIEMPGILDGLQLARISAEVRPHMPVVVVSGGVRPNRAELGASATFIAKPYGMPSVLAALAPHEHSQAA